MASYIWPVALVVLSNTLYQICAKSIPETVNPIASLTITYLTAAAASVVLYCVLNRDVNLVQQWRQINWASIVLGLVLVGLEAGFIYAYKAGWQVSTAATVQSAFLAILLLAVGVALYHEAITWNKIVGVAVCLIGLAILNK
ncbi:MAG: EamA family transporter [Butyricicoccus sp.]|jgi:drug/metabolite transporter (DMT)-like permease|nr:EamA family transporter [Clostridiales bacterium]